MLKETQAQHWATIAWKLKLAADALAEARIAARALEEGAIVDQVSQTRNEILDWRLDAIKQRQAIERG